MIVRQQFNKQASKFSAWSCTKNLEYMDRYFEFCGLKADDYILDVACGSGELASYYSDRVRHITGVDIAENMIDLAMERASSQELGNVEFICHDVEQLPFADETFSFVLCKSSFHHMAGYEQVFAEMARCCQVDGRLSIQDIMAHEDPYVNDFFERFEKVVDISHHHSLTKDEFMGLYGRNGLRILSDFSVEVDLDLLEYIEHAIQSEEDAALMQKMIDAALKDRAIGDYLFEKDGRLFLKRAVILTLGRKTGRI